MTREEFYDAIPPKKIAKKMDLAKTIIDTRRRR